jgi:hypothetical protein
MYHASDTPNFQVKNGPFGMIYPKVGNGALRESHL